MEQLHLTAIKHRAGLYDQTGDWPVEDLDALAAAGAMRWAIGKEHGGEALSPLELHLRYEWIAAASVSTALILTQRDSAVGLIDASDNALKQELLPRFARNEMFATVGIAQLTTSHQSGAPALKARRESNGWRVDGLIPWATGADRSRFVVTGAAAEEGQILFALSTTWEGVTLSPPMPLVALSSSHTGSIACENVLVEDKCVLAGPVPNVLSIRKKNVPIGQAFLAMGLCRAGIELIDEHDSDLARQASHAFQEQLTDLRDRVIHYCDPAIAPDPADAPKLRGACNDLALRVTHAAVAVYKGTALMHGHPAQRLSREALFLLVWSCPNPVIDCTVELLASACAR